MAQLAVYPAHAHVVTAAAFGVLYFAIGLYLLGPARAALWCGALFPLIGGSLGIYRFIVLQPNPFTVLHVLIDLVVIGSHCIGLDYLLGELQQQGVRSKFLAVGSTAGLDAGVAITAGEARRLACSAGLVPAVLGGTSMPLDLGRSRRLHDRTQRRALALTHDTCGVAGCERPFAWCEIHHHRLAWAQGGRTDLANGLPLCGHHHRRAHDPRFDLRRRPDGDWAFHRRT